MGQRKRPNFQGAGRVGLVAGQNRVAVVAVLLVALELFDRLADEFRCLLRRAGCEAGPEHARHAAQRAEQIQGAHQVVAVAEVLIGVQARAHGLQAVQPPQGVVKAQTARIGPHQDQSMHHADRTTKVEPETGTTFGSERWNCIGRSERKASKAAGSQLLRVDIMFSREAKRSDRDAASRRSFS